MKKTLLLPAAAAVAMGFAQSAAAFTVDPGERIYVIGSMTGWSIDETPYVLDKQPTGEYRGLVYCNPDDSYLRFYTAFGDYESNSIGCQPDDMAVDFSMEGNALFTEVYEGKGSWHLTDAKGWVEISLDMDYLTVSFQPVTLGDCWIYSDDLGSHSAADNFDYSSISRDGDFSFRFQTTTDTGHVYDFGPKTIYSNYGAYLADDPSLYDGVKRRSLSLMPSKENYRVLDSHADDALSATPDFNACKLSLQRASFDPANLTFEVAEGYQRYCYAYNYAYNISQFLNVDPAIDWSLVEINTDAPINIASYHEDGIEFFVEGEGTYTFTVSSQEIPGKELNLKLTFVNPIAPEYTICTADGTRTDMVLTPTGNNIFTGTFTIPEGEGDFEFYLDGPEGFGDAYTLHNGDGGPIFDLGQESASMFLSHYSDVAIIIPAGYRGQTYDFRYRTSGPDGTLQINHQGYVAPVTFEWRDADSPLVFHTGENTYLWPDSYLIMDQDIDLYSVRYSIEPEVEGIYFSEFSLFISDTYSGPTEVTIKATTDELEARGIHAEKTMKILPMHPAELVFVSNDSRIGDASLVPNVDEPSKYSCTFTIPEGDDDFRFRFADAELSGHYSYGNADMIDLSTGASRINIWNNNYDELTIPAAFRGQTYTFTIDVRNNTLTVALEGMDLDAITVTPDENNPENAVLNKPTTFYFNVSALNPDGVEFRTEGYADVWNAYQIDGSRYLVEVSSYEETSFTLIASKWFNDEYRELYRQEINTVYVPIESYTAPESIIIHEGEFASVAADIQPVLNSFDTHFWSESSEDGIARIFDDSETGGCIVLASKPGTFILHWCSNDRYGNQQEHAVTTVTVLPREAVEAEHIFHASLAIGQDMNLKLSAHKDRSFAEATWTSSNPEIVSVDAFGTVSALADGTALITADCGDHRSYIGIIAGSGTSSIDNATAARVSAYGHDGNIYITGAPEGSTIRIFDASGKTRASRTATGATDKIAVGKGIFLITAGNDIFKLAL